MRRHNEGSIYFRKRRQRWCASVSIPDGMRRELECPWHDNSSDKALELLSQLRAERDAGLVPARKLTVAAYLSGWLADLESARQISPRTLAAYRWAVEGHIIPVFGAVQLARLTPTAIQRWLDGLALSPQSRANCHDVLRAALNTAAKRGKLAQSPMPGADRPKVPRHRATVLSAQQAGTLIEGTRGEWWHALWTVLLGTGLRISEAKALNWQDFDREHARLTVNKQLVRDGDQWAFAKTKAGRELSNPALPPFAVEALRAHEVMMAAARKPEWAYFGLIFLTPDGVPPWDVGPALSRACQQLGLPRVKPHELRHSNLTMLADAGVPEDVRQRRAGQNTAAMARRYTTQAEVADRDAADALDRAIFPVR